MMKALIVEDERMAQAQLARLLKTHIPDIEVVQCTASVAETVAYLAADPPIDIVFMDVELADGEDNLSKVGQRSGPNVTAQVFALIVNLEQSLAYITVKGVIKVTIAGAVDG